MMQHVYEYDRAHDLMNAAHESNDDELGKHMNSMNSFFRTHDLNEYYHMR